MRRPWSRIRCRACRRRRGGARARCGRSRGARRGPRPRRGGARRRSTSSEPFRPMPVARYTGSPVATWREARSRSRERRVCRSLPIISAMSPARSMSRVRCSPTSLPLRSTVRRSLIAKTWSRKWETKRMATPSSRRRRITRKRPSTSSASRLEVGSSRFRSFASSTVARLIATSCCSARLMVESGVRGSRWPSPHARQHLGGGGVRALPIDAEAAAPLVAEHDVLADGEVPAEVDLLVDRGDPRGLRVGGAGEAALGAVDDDASGVDPVDARERLDQRRLPGAVLAHERVDLAGEEPEVHPVERLDAREGDGDAPHLDDGAGCLHARAPFLRRRRRLAGGGGGANDPPRLPVWPCGRVRTSGRAARWRPSRRSRTRRTGRRSTTRRSRRRAASARPRARCRRTAGCTRRRS